MRVEFDFFFMGAWTEEEISLFVAGFRGELAHLKYPWEHFGIDWAQALLASAHGHLRESYGHWASGRGHDLGIKAGSGCGMRLGFERSVRCIWLYAVGSLGRLFPNYYLLLFMTGIDPRDKSANLMRIIIEV